ncbi:MAG: glycosyltransferase family 4 protein [Candidatus Levybacteria bacterium]|nr:glycosyltransferase family 4 protein [Candidatus Levybacteria bacterium]
MRIGIFDPYLDDGGGGEKYMLTIAECLAAQHDVSLFWDNKADLDAVKKRFSLALNGVRLQKNVFASHISMWERLHVTQQYDAIIVLSDGSIPLTLSKKLFLHIQQPLSHAETAGIMAGFKTARITSVFYNSSYTKEYNRKLFPSTKNTILYPPVTIYGKQLEKENLILHVGRYRKVKGTQSDYKKQQFMLETFKKMVDDGLRGWKFIIAAGLKDTDTDAFVELQTMGKGYPIEYQINVSNEALFNLYHKAKIYWHASGFGENLHAYPELAEHFGISTVEAMGSGAVPVVLNAGGQKEIINNNVNGLLWTTQEEFIEKTQSVIQNQELREHLSLNAIKRSKDFSKEKFCQNIHELIRM